MTDTTPSNRVRDILNASSADLTPDAVYTAIQVAERRRDRADEDICKLNAKFVEVAMAGPDMPSVGTLRKLSRLDGNAAISVAKAAKSRRSEPQ